MAEVKTVDPEIAVKDVNGDGHISNKNMRWIWNLKEKR